MVSWAASLLVVSLGVMLCADPAMAQASSSGSEQVPEVQQAGSVSGTIVDRTGTAVVGARVQLVRDEQAANQEMVTSEDGQFSFANVAPGSFRITITATGFASQDFSGVLRSGDAFRVPQITLVLATAVTEVRVVPNTVEIAEEQMKEEEKQRVLGVLPNFYVTYIPNAAPLNTRQKFRLAWKSMVDPVTFGVTGVIAGIQQSQNDFSGYGQGAQGYAKRYGASYADAAISTFIGGAILPSVFKQDPRYFYKGTGSKKSRVLYALANSVICKGDNGRWQANYSGLIGSVAAGGISNLYYPASDRSAAAVTFENALIGIGATAATNLLQEFVIKKFTPNVPNYPPATP
jgi:hypothetical protein